jgi:hypothetical protein
VQEALPAQIYMAVISSQTLLIPLSVTLEESNSISSYNPDANAVLSPHLKPMGVAGPTRAETSGFRDLRDDIMQKAEWRLRQQLLIRLRPVSPGRQYLVWA